MNVIFAGTPVFAVPSLQALLDSEHQVIAVMTQPDRPAGRGRQLMPSPVKQCAQAAGIDVVQPSTLRDTHVQAWLASMQPDVIVVVAYGCLIPRAILTLPPHGCINVHPSLLPRWRGAAPIQHTILSGDQETGVAIMQLDEGMDTGPILKLEKTVVKPCERSDQLHDRLAVLGSQLLVDVIDTLPLPARPQSTDGVTHAHKIKKADASICWGRSAQSIQQQVCAYNPWPVAQTVWNDQVLRIWQAHAIDEASQSPPGSIVRLSKLGIDVAAGENSVRVTHLQLPGTKVMTADEMVNRMRDQWCVGTQFGSETRA